MTFPVGLGLCLSNLGRVASRGGRYDEARELFAESRRHFERIGADAFLVELDSREAERLLLAGESAAALALAERRGVEGGGARRDARRARDARPDRRRRAGAERSA